MHCVYILQHTVTKQIYIGKTSNLKRRLAEHNAGKEKATRRLSGEWVVIYAEAYRSTDDAAKRELRLKHHGRAKQEVLKRASSSQIY